MQKEQPMKKALSIKTISPKAIIFWIIILGACIKLCAFSKEQVVDYEDLLCTKENNILTCTDKKLKPFSGVFIVRNGNLIREMTHCKNGKPDGISKLYYNQGQLKEKNMFKKGRLNGLSKLYYDNGQLKAESFFKNNQLNGVVKTYDQNGNIQEEVHYKNNRIEGALKTYYENGQLKTENTIKDDQPVGTGKLYYENGNLMIKSTFEDGLAMTETCYEISGAEVECAELEALID